MTQSPFDLVIVGSGPAGLACGIAAKRHGLTTLIVDQGSIVDAIRRFPTFMTFFSSADLLEIGGVPFLSAGLRPTRVEALRYYGAVAQKADLKIRTQTTVQRVQADGGTFRVISAETTFIGRHVVVATGYFDDPRPFPVPGVDLPKVLRYYDEPYRYRDLDVAVVGGKNSAVETALDLHRNGARVTLVHRGAGLSEGIKYWILPDIENRISSGEITTFFGASVKEIRKRDMILQSLAGERKIANDVVFVMIGYSPSGTLLQGAGVIVDPETGVPQHQPETMETNVPGLYIAGSIAAGNFNNKIFIENGRLHGEMIVKAIVGKR